MLTTGQSDNSTYFDKLNTSAQYRRPNIQATRQLMITSLPFDSSLFGYSVGKCLADDAWSEFEFLKAAKSYRLVYLFSDEPLDFRSLKIQPVDLRLTFFKNLKRRNVENAEIQPYSGSLSETLQALAFESGVYSRFHTDPRFVNREFEKLYQLWIEKALTRQEVLIAKDQAGFVSCSVDGYDAQIGLIAVQKNHRNKGWGKNLILAAENFALQKGACTMTIGTQAANLPASVLYQSIGYQLIEKNFIYHYWG